MAVRLINYRKEQRRGMDVTGYTIYINSNFYSIYDTYPQAVDVAGNYASYNDVEIYPILKRRPKYESQRTLHTRTTTRV